MSWRERILGGLLLTLALGAAVAAASPASTDGPLAITDCSYGEVFQFEPAGCTASIENATGKALTLSVAPVQRVNAVEPDRLTLAPHARADVHLHISTDNVAGTVGGAFRVTGAGDKALFVRANGFVSSVLDVATPRVDFGSLDAAALPALRTFALSSSIDSSTRVARVLAKPSMMQVHPDNDGRSLTIEVGPDAPWGTFDDTIRLAISSKVQKQVSIEVVGNVPGDVEPLTNPQWLGEIPRQRDIALSIPLVDRENRDFTIGSVRSADFAATYGDAPCEPARVGCRNLLVHISEVQPSGLFKGHLNVDLPDRKKHLTVGIWGVLGERPRAGEAASAPLVTKVPLAIPTEEDGVTAIPPLMTQAEPPGTGPLLKWTISQQQAVHGYQVLRGNAADGPFTLMEPRVIAKLDNGRGPVAYRWRDMTAVAGRTYWYYIAVLYQSGDRKALSPPHATIAK